MNDTEFGELNLKVLPVTKSQRRGALQLTLRGKGEQWRLCVSKSGRQAIDCAEKSYVQLLVGRGVIAIRKCKGTESQARTLNTVGEVAFNEAPGLLELEDGQAWKMPAFVCNGHLIAYIPADMKIRRKAT